jgi:beta-glucosidase
MGDQNVPAFLRWQLIEEAGGSRNAPWDLQVDSIMPDRDIEKRARDLLGSLNQEEKIGQLCLVNGSMTDNPEELKKQIASGKIGGILNEVNRQQIEEYQRVALEESPGGIPLLIGRDVIHGFKTVFPIPLAQAASFNPDIIRLGARIAAMESAYAGVNWTYAPMMDIGRDPRWGRVAETLGEDVHLSSELASAMVEGFQGDDLASPGSIAACAKHFAGYGASESGRDYNTTNIPENELRNVHLPPFKTAVDAGVASIMTSFSDLDGIPASANEFLLKTILRDEWKYDGMVVSDWESISQLQVHGLTENDLESAYEAARAGVDMEMASTTYCDHLPELIDSRRIATERLDELVLNVLRMKLRMGLFEAPVASLDKLPVPGNDDHLKAARQAALESCVLLKNQKELLPLNAESMKSVAVIGPLADSGYEQLGTWVFDGDWSMSVTPLAAIREHVGDECEVRYVQALESTRSLERAGFREALDAAENSDVALLFLGEEAILTGEAHCRADIELPGGQADLLREIAKTGTPVVVVLMTGRPLALESVTDEMDSLLVAWHGGNMAGPAVADLLFGV